jgi:hypothetical protein
MAGSVNLDGERGARGKFGKHADDTGMREGAF